MRVICVTFFILLNFLGCKQTNKDASIIVEHSASKSTNPINSSIGLLTLEKEVEEKMILIPSFGSVQKRIDSIHKKSYSTIENTASELSIDIADLYKSIPTDIKNNQILSRINQLQTYTLLLKNSISSKPDSLHLAKITNNTLKSYNSLIIQLNETRNTISEDFKKELEKAKFNRDSLKQNEVAPLF